MLAIGLLLLCLRTAVAANLEDTLTSIRGESSGPLVIGAAGFVAKEQVDVALVDHPGLARVLRRVSAVDDAAERFVERNLISGDCGVVVREVTSDLLRLIPVGECPRDAPVELAVLAIPDPVWAPREDAVPGRRVVPAALGGVVGSLGGGVVSGALVGTAAYLGQQDCYIACAPDALTPIVLVAGIGSGMILGTGGIASAAGRYRFRTAVGGAALGTLAALPLSMTAAALLAERWEEGAAPFVFVPLLTLPTVGAIVLGERELRRHRRHSTEQPHATSSN